MFFDFSNFGPLSCLLMFSIMIYYVFFHGRRIRKRRKKYSYLFSSNSSSETSSLYPAGTKIHRNYNVTRREFRKDNKKWLDRYDYFMTGDYITSKDGNKEVFINTVMHFIGKTLFVDMVYDYAGFKDGSALPENIDIMIDAQTIRSITVYKSGNSVYMRLKIDDPELPEEMLFEFNGPDAASRAEEARRRILAERDNPYKVEN